MKEVRLSDHAKKRAKERFKYSIKTLTRLSKKAWSEGTKTDYQNSIGDKATSRRLGHINFMFREYNDYVLLVTITSLQEKGNYMSKIQNNYYIKGTKATNKFRDCSSKKGR